MYKLIFIITIVFATNILFAWGDEADFEIMNFQLINEQECKDTGYCEFEYELNKPSYDGYSDYNMKVVFGDKSNPVNFYDYDYENNLQYCIDDGDCTLIDNNKIRFSHTYVDHGWKLDDGRTNYTIALTLEKDWDEVEEWFGFAVNTVRVEDLDFEQCIRASIDKPSGYIFESELEGVHMQCDTMAYTHDMKRITDGTDLTIQGVFGKVIFQKFIPGRMISDIFIAGLYNTNGIFIPGIQGARGYIPGIFRYYNNEAIEFIPGIFDDEYKFHPGLIRGDTFIPGKIIENRFVPGIISSENDKFIPGTYINDTHFVPGIFADGGFVPGKVISGKLIPGVFIDDIFIEGPATSIGDAIRIDKIGQLGGGLDNDGMGPAGPMGGYSKGNGHYEAGIGWMPSAGEYDQHGGTKGDISMGAEGVGTQGRYEPGIGWVGSPNSQGAAGRMGPGYGGRYDPGSGKLIPGVHDDYSSYVGSKSKDKTKENNDGTKTTTKKETTTDAQGNKTTTTTVTKEKEHDDGSKTTKETKGTVTEDKNGNKSLKVTEKTTHTDANGNSESNEVVVMESTGSDAAEDFKDMMIVAGCAALGSKFGTAGAVGGAIFCYWLTKTPADPYGDVNHPAFSSDFYPADPWQDGDNPYALGNNCYPSDPWGEGGEVFLGIEGYPADVDGTGGTVFYNMNQIQQY